MKKQFDRFVLTDLIAQGAGGSLYHGEERLPGGVARPVRVKVFASASKADPQAETRFVEEVRVMAALAGHPHVVTFYGVGLTDGVPWVAMEHAPSTLASLLGGAPAAAQDVARLVEHVARGLAALHGLQPARLHNRLNPGNVLACTGNHFKVTEFGLAAPVTAEPTLSADSARYAAPELLAADAGRPGPASDLYALGHLAYEFALGAKLHRQQFSAVAEGKPDLADAGPARWQAWHHSMPTTVTPVHELIPSFPQALGQVIAKLLTKPVAQRYASADEVLADLSSGAIDSATPSPVQQPAPAAAGAPATAAAPRTSAGAKVAPPPLTLSRGASPQPAAGIKYFVRLRNSTSGPYDLPTLQRMSRQGQVSRLHQVSTDQRTWLAAASVDGLFG